jgi:hypothetical protein
MKKLGWILAYLSFLSLNAQAGLPPTTAKGQDDASASVTFNLQVPGSQSTRINGTTALIETGNDNLVPNPGAEGPTVTNFAAYADAAGTAPVDMTGGSPNTTCGRTTSSPLAGSASYLMTVNSGATRQGEGCAFQTLNIPLGKRGKTLTASFDYATTGTLVAGDFVLYAYQIDGASPKVLTTQGVPTASLLGTSGTATVTFTPDTDATQVRFGIHVARATNTGAVTITADSFKIQPGVASYGMAGSNWISYTPTFTGFGTVSTSNMYYRRVGDSVQVHGTFVSGTVTGAQAQVSFPTGLTVDSSKSPSSTYYTAGQFARNTAPSSAGAFYAITEGGQSTLSFGIESTSLTPLTPQNASAIFTTGDTISIYATVPIAGWDSGVSMANSAVWRASYALASGSRVTAQPTAIGQYRSFFKSVNSSTGTDGAPTTGPNSANGMKIASVPYASAGSTDPNRYEIFVGTGLNQANVKCDWYVTTGRSGSLDVTNYISSSGTFEVGASCLYDPATGVVTVDTMYEDSSAITTRRIGAATGSSGAALGTTSGCYFDVIVSANAQMVGLGVGPRARYTTTTAQSLPNNTVTTLKYDTKDFDNFLSYNTSTGVYTCSWSGYYHVDAAFSTTVVGTGEAHNIRIIRNSTTMDDVSAVNFSGSTAFQLSPQAHDTFYCNQGDTISIADNNTSAGSRTLDTTAGRNVFSVFWQGP